jgi:hypothetical protein
MSVGSAEMFGDSAVCVPCRRTPCGSEDFLAVSDDVRVVS